MTTIDLREILAILNDPAIADPADYLRRKLTDLISPTMAEVEWEDGVHAGLCAEHPDHEVVRMMYADGGMIDCILPDMSLLMISAKDLTPLPGTRVDLTPRREPEPESTSDHPTELTTVEDYRKAPEGTVARQGATIIERRGITWFSMDGNKWNVSAASIAEGGTATVLHWGSWGKHEPR